MFPSSSSQERDGEGRKRYKPQSREMGRGDFAVKGSRGPSPRLADTAGLGDQGKERVLSGLSDPPKGKGRQALIPGEAPFPPHPLYNGLWSTRPKHTERASGGF